MPSTNELQNFLSDLISGAQKVGVMWQLVVLVASLGLSWWWLRRAMIRRIAPQVTGRPQDPGTRGTGRILLRGRYRVLFPLFALILLVFGKWVLDHWYSTHLLSIAVPLLSALALIRAVIYMLHKVFSSQELLHPWERFIGWTVWTGLVLYVTGLLPEILTFLDGISFQIGKQRFSVVLVVQGIVMFCASMLVALWLAGALGAGIMNTSALDINRRVILSKILRTTLILLGILIALPLVGADITVLSVFGGALGVGLGLGLQTIASNYISGFIILLDHSLHIGDTVTVEGRRGEVTSLTTRYVVLKSDDGTDALIPNDVFITSAVVSQTFSDHRSRLVVPIQISYASSVETAMDIMLNAAKTRKQVLADPEPVVFLKEFDASGINLELYVWVENPGGSDLGELGPRSDINTEIWSEFQKHGIELPFPQHEVRLLQ
ncbi:mechanosensitive ion channel family protein [Nitrosospira sp. Nsp1]|uniref:mechanosensitive ion channel family protein n=1 Tax=Nitrosospira sp. Nsp1 TaxID=136547 RepID=UPI0008863F59|nr:mechanosensitive ion channel domain-containing protein [Nitrosospira sp. Nsp1]SCX54933.1 Mechanosensitive ion channel [Nitrosospira sp. Nsp1]